MKLTNYQAERKLLNHFLSFATDRNHPPPIVIDRSKLVTRISARVSFFIVDVEADGPIPADYSMVCLGAVLFDDPLDTTFYGRVRPISERFIVNWIV